MKRRTSPRAGKPRAGACSWPGADPLMQRYHDREWGKPEFDDRKIFRAIVLDTFQAGLSWRIVLHKRENFAKAFANFDWNKVSKFGTKEVKRLMNDSGIVRNRLKIEGTIANARAFNNVRKEFGTFSKYIWAFVGNKPIINKLKHSSHIASSTDLSDKISLDMKSRGFKFCGTTVTYAFMQGIGMVNDHLITCFRYKELKKVRGRVRM